MKHAMFPFFKQPMAGATLLQAERSPKANWFPPVPEPMGISLQTLASNLLDTGRPGAPHGVAPAELLAVQLWFIERGLRDWARSTGAEPKPILRRRRRRRSSLLRQLGTDNEELAADLALLRRVHGFSVVSWCGRLRWHSNPAAKTSSEVASACIRVATWAESAGLLPFAVAYAELSAWITPANPVAMNLAGRLNRDVGNYRRADAFFERSIGLCRGYLDRGAGHGLTKKQRRAIGGTKARAFMGWGTRWREEGNYARALHLYQQGAWCAQRWGGKWLAAEVHHDMLVLASEQGLYERAETYVARALAVYPVHNNRIPAFVYDFALLLARQQIFQPARELLRLATDYMATPHDVVLAESLLARVAAGAGSVEEFAEITSRVTEAIRFGLDLRAAGAFIHLAFGARCLGLWQQAEEFAGEAVRIVDERMLGGEERTLAYQLQREMPMRITEPGARSLPQPTGNETPLLTANFLRLMEVTRGWRGPTWRRKNQAGPEDRGKT